MADRYWVGGDGNVSDNANHWSASTGGAPNASKPGASDTAIFDAASNATGYTVTINEATTWGAATIGAPASGNLTITTSAAKTNSISLAGNVTVAGTPSIGGNSAINRLLIASNTVGTARTINTTGATVTWANVTVRDITLTPVADLSAISGGSSNAGGNTGITFTTPATYYYHQATAGADNFSTLAKWFTATNGGGSAANQILAQDTLKFDANSFDAAGATVTQDMPRIGSVDWTGATNGPTWTTSTVAEVYGSITLISAMTLTASTETYTFMGRGAYTLTSGGKTWAKTIELNAPNGTLTLSDALACDRIQVTAGAFVTAGFNTTSQSLGSIATSFSRTVNISNSTIIITEPEGIPWNVRSAGLTLVTTGSAIKFTGTGASSKTFAGANQVYNTLWFSPGTGTGEYRIENSNTFAQLKDDGSAAHSVKFAKSTTQTIGYWVISGHSGALITLDTIDGAGTFALSKSIPGIVRADYLDIQRSVAAGTGAVWYAGANSVDNNGAGSGWIFSAAPKNGGLLLRGEGN